VNSVHADQTAVVDAAHAMASRIAANSPLAVLGAKQVLAFGEGKTVAEGLAYVAAWNAAFVASEDLGEAVTAFFEKRPPRFRGRSHPREEDFGMAIEQLLSREFLRVVEEAAIAAARSMGQGDRKYSDQCAVEAMTASSTTRRNSRDKSC